MIRVINGFTTAMEFTRFRKNDTVTDDELMKSVLKFEKELAKQEGVVFHCLVRNLSGEYANVLFVKEQENLIHLSKAIKDLPVVQDFFKQIDPESIQMQFHKVYKPCFQVPEYFSCFECGTFSLKVPSDIELLMQTSKNLEEEYLATFKNTQAHFMGSIGSNHYSEITFGETLAQTKEICFGYFDNYWGKQLLRSIDETTMQLDFWYLIA